MARLTDEELRLLRDAADYLHRLGMRTLSSRLDPIIDRLDSEPPPEGDDLGWQHSTELYGTHPLGSLPGCCAPEGDDLAAVPVAPAIYAMQANRDRLAELRAEGRRWYAAYRAGEDRIGEHGHHGWHEWVDGHAPALLADPPDSLPEGEVVLDGERYRATSLRRSVRAAAVGGYETMLVPVTERGER